MVYEPQEDSYLIQAAVKKYVKGEVLEIGTGSGILAETAAMKRNVKSVLAVDIDKEAIAHCRKKVKGEKVQFIISDLFSKVPKKKYDLVMFNPPYLPADEREPADLALATTGGKKGYELTVRFLDSVADYLKDDGCVLLLFSTLTRKERVEEAILANMLCFEEVNSLKIAFETLYVYKIMKTKLRILLEKKGVTKVRLLARGHRGLIYTGQLGRQKVAIKMQRQDIDATGTVDNEAKMLKLLNKKDIGPELLFAGKDFFVYKFVEGEFVLDFLGHATKAQAVKLLKDVYKQMFILDSMMLNKEEMHHPVKHIVVTKKGKAVLLDFERCRKREKRHNVTQFTQFIISGLLRRYLEKIGLIVDKKRLLEAAKGYSEDQRKEKFERILSLI
ncbi:TPA: methyltransferase [Candidatus Woesearchaeota archaeon]|nr:methyltransferase [Candidatus Woesearchaeota archaeon]